MQPSAARLLPALATVLVLLSRRVSRGAQSRPWLVASLLAVPLLSGCIGVAQASAMETRSDADSKAEAWASDAKLAGVMGVEGTFSSEMMSGLSGKEQETAQKHMARAADDEEIGDGKCEVWMYLYVSESKSGAYAVVVDRDGKVLEEYATDDTDEMVPVGEWKVDSDKALATALEANEGLAKGTGSDQYGIMQMLGRESETENAKWFVMGGGGDADGGGGGMVVVDAVTGEVLGTWGGFGDMMGGMQGWDGWGGNSGGRVAA